MPFLTSNHIASPGVTENDSDHAQEEAAGLTGVIDNTIGGVSNVAPPRDLNPEDLQRVGGVMTFPPSLGTAAGRPFIHFHANEIARGGGGLQADIFLPIPAGISFEDGGSYSTIDFGAAGAFAEHAKDAMATDQTVNRTKLWADAKAAMGAQGMKLLEPVGGEKVMVATRLAMNPNTNTTFQSNNLRSFTFEFKMVGRSAGEDATIRNIHNTFRRGIYPHVTKDASNIIMHYPPTWHLFFRNTNAVGGAENEYIPKVYECYLTTLASSFNPSASMFRNGSIAPVEVQINLTFQETRTLTRLDIEQKYNAG